MTTLIDASPSAGSYRAIAFTTGDIDAHPDCDRIWATITSLLTASAAVSASSLASAIEDARDDERDECNDDLARACRIERRKTDDEATLAAINQISECLS